MEQGTGRKFITLSVEELLKIVVTLGELVKAQKDAAAASDALALLLTEIAARSGIIGEEEGWIVPPPSEEIHKS